MPHSRPQKILETNGGILHGLQHKRRILDTQPGPEIRDMMLLASLAENLSVLQEYMPKRKKQPQPRSRRGKRWVEIHSNKGKNEPMTPTTEWTQNLQISGPIETNTDAKVVSWNIGPHGYKGSKEAVH